MELIKRQILTWLVICFFIGGFYAKKTYPCKINEDCKALTYAYCKNGKCGCHGRLVLGEKSCVPGPLHKCKTDADCDKKIKFEIIHGVETRYVRGKCEEGKCVCQGTTIGNGRYCRDPHSLCSESKRTELKNHDCGFFGVCVIGAIMNLTPRCKCQKGYVNAGGTLGGRCVECDSNKDCKMKYHSKCVKGECKCKDELKRHEGKTCKRAPLHSCKTSSDCHPKADCFRGECHCRGRTTGNGDYCRDSMSCPAAAESKCHETSICVLDPLLPIGADKPECKCRDGYQKLEASGSNGPITDATNRNDTKCEEMTDCTMHGIVCPSGTICAQLNGIYDCTCETGFKIVIKAGRKTCQDIDECSEIEPCSSDAVCKNSHGSYECKCNAGYRKNAEDKDYCEDWDECSEMKNPCGVGEKCENQPGTYTCMCDTGYVKAYNGACVKYGECNCQENEECIEGRCKCLEGYKRNKLRHCVHQSTRLQGLGYSFRASCYLNSIILGLLGGLAFTA
ncbi:uncharacterized protein LOC144657668 [Oculina patagonica]